MSEEIAEATESTEAEDKGKFKKLKSTPLDELLKEGAELPESDLTVQTDTHLHQFEYIEHEEEKKKYLIKPGCWNIEDTSMGTSLTKLELRDYDLLKIIDNTSKIIEQKKMFFDNLDMYRRRKRQPKRSILLCSPPGVGKTAAINDVARASLAEDKGACVINWDTSGVRSRSVNSFFLNYSKFKSTVTSLIFVIEDISGMSTEEEHGAKGTDSSLLNLLDGMGNPFKGIPTFIIATTNNPEREVGALIDRPGRFDKVIELSTPGEKECLALLEYFTFDDYTLTEDDKEAAAKAAKNKFSIAHMQEIVDRSLIEKVPMLEVCNQMIEHKERFKKAFQDYTPMGIMNR